MTFKPIDKMWERVEVAREDSNTALFFDLLYLGEMLTKTVTAALVAAITEESNRHSYRQLHKLVRADSLGDWAVAIDDILTGPASQYLVSEAREEQRELTKNMKPDAWQHKATVLLTQCLTILKLPVEDLPGTIAGRRWFSTFAYLRNKTRGHGAPTGDDCNRICRDLEFSIRLICDNFILFRRPWAYLYRNLSGKYRVTSLSANTEPFEPLKSGSSGPLPNLVDGIYVYFDRPVHLALLESTVDAADFYYPNGGFNGKRYELISYITNDKRDADARQYLPPAGMLPVSETQGIGKLDAQAQSFGNLPPAPKGYIHRKKLESELCDVLTNDRHPIVTLLGMGGIGKTSLALTVLHEISKSKKFDAILWFSARDIDLLQDGPKLVKPHILDQTDIAKEFTRLFEPPGFDTKGFEYVTFFSGALTKGHMGGPMLFVFDNFETVTSTADLYAWLDTYIRLPNKILITTRHRDFKGDYPVDVSGMTFEESEELINITASNQGIGHLLTPSYYAELYQEADGHPYVMKVLLGEVAKAGKLVKVERIVASREEILDALFERTFAGLSPAARRVYLTLSNWRSAVPQLALEAVLLRPENDKMDVEAAIEELHRSSFVEVVYSEEDNMPFLSLPLVAYVFGKRKLAVSPMKTAIEADTQLLHAVGATKPLDIQHGIGPRIERMFRQVAEWVSSGRTQLDTYLPTLEFIARHYPPAWLLLASLYEESADDLEGAKNCVTRYLESTPGDDEQVEAWRTLSNLSQRTEDWIGEAHCLIELCQLPSVSFSELSNSANRINFLFSQHHLVLDTVEKRILIQRLIQVMQGRIDEADAVDCSRLAWLCMHTRDHDRALYYAQRGLSIDPNNGYCRKLIWQLDAV